MTTTSVTSFDPSWHVTPTDIALDNRQDPQRSRHRPSRLLLPDWHSHDTSCCKNWRCNNPDTGDMGQRWLRAVHKDASAILGIAVGKSGERNMTLPAHSRLTHNPCTRHAHRLSAQQHYYEYDYYFPSTSIIMITSSTYYYSKLLLRWSASQVLLQSRCGLLLCIGNRQWRLILRCSAIRGAYSYNTPENRTKIGRYNTEKQSCYGTRHFTVSESRKQQREGSR